MPFQTSFLRLKCTFELVHHLGCRQLLDGFLLLAVLLVPGWAVSEFGLTLGLSFLTSGLIFEMVFSGWAGDAGMA
jgi:hypothetical protein